MDAVSMHRFAEAMPRAVKDMAAIPGLLEHVSRRPVDLPPVQLSSCHGRLFNQRQGRVARTNNGVEGASGLVGNAGSREAYPCDISKHCAWLAHLAPKVQQQHLVRHDRRSVLT